MDPRFQQGLPQPQMMRPMQHAAPPGRQPPFPPIGPPMGGPPGAPRPPMMGRGGFPPNGQMPPGAHLHVHQGGPRAMGGAPGPGGAPQQQAGGGQFFPPQMQGGRGMQLSPPGKGGAPSGGRAAAGAGGRMAGRGREGGRGRGSWHHDPQVPAPPQLQMERIDSAGRQQHVALPRPLERGDSGARKRRKDLGGSPGATDRERGGEGRAVPSRGSPTYEPYTGTDSRPSRRRSLSPPRRTLSRRLSDGGVGRSPPPHRKRFSSKSRSKSRSRSPLPARRGGGFGGPPRQRSPSPSPSPSSRGGGRRHSPLLRTGSGPGGGSGVMRTTGDLSKLQPAVRAKLDAWKSRGGPSIGKAQNELDPRALEYLTQFSDVVALKVVDDLVIAHERNSIRNLSAFLVGICKKTSTSTASSRTLGGPENGGMPSQGTRQAQKQVGNRWQSADQVPSGQAPPGPPAPLGQALGYEQQGPALQLQSLAPSGPAPPQGAPRPGFPAPSRPQQWPPNAPNQTSNPQGPRPHMHQTGAPMFPRLPAQQLPFQAPPSLQPPTDQQGAPGAAPPPFLQQGQQGAPFSGTGAVGNHHRNQLPPQQQGPPFHLAPPQQEWQGQQPQPWMGAGPQQQQPHNLQAQGWQGQGQGAPQNPLPQGWQGHGQQNQQQQPQQPHWQQQQQQQPQQWLPGKPQEAYQAPWQQQQQHGQAGGDDLQRQPPAPLPAAAPQATAPGHHEPLRQSAAQPHDPRGGTSALPQDNKPQGFGVGQTPVPASSPLDLNALIANTLNMLKNKSAQPAATAAAATPAIPVAHPTAAGDPPPPAVPVPESEAESPLTLRKSVLDHIKEAMKPAWKAKRVDRDTYKMIAWKVLTKVLDSKGHLVDDTPQAITEFLTDSRRKKITRIVDSYIDRFAGEGQRPGSPGAHAKDRRAILAI